ncbi:Ser-Thr-rich GPI-anchored membrane family protein [Okeania sp. KiyG1]|uniref:Ser-Thr-rich GPI-anchored membrane family protein n=1 Tax=Okeania sp. KiyG1 TaxID=2720165 RepID=UPI00192154C0|nr:Ser-Thr-rich GPI-anchored membrane family protein [Okeania sp. KiyG1]GGA29826.1 hypothetical protein CYANOKiyG1_46280 [Okeania sp. KiyG1]
MDNIFGEASRKLGPEFTDPMLAGIDGAKVSDELRSATGIESSAESSEVKVENLSTGNDELLLPQNGLGTLGLSESQESQEKTSIEKEDPLIGKENNVVEEVDSLTGDQSNEIEAKTRTAQRRDRAGNSRGKAYNFGVLKDDEKLREFVGRSDRRDFYKFRVKEKTEVDIELRGLSGNADLYLLNNKGKVLEKSTKGGKKAEDIERTLNPGTYYVRVQPKGNANANYTLSLDAHSPHSHTDEPIVINIVDTAADAPTSLDDSSTIDLMVVYTPEARRAEGGTDAMKDLIEFAVDDTNEAFAKSGVKSQLRLVHTAEVNYTESGKSDTELERLQKPSDGYMDEVHKLRQDYGADIVSLFASDFDDAGGRGFLMGTPAYGFERYAFNVVTNYNARNRHTLAHEIGHNLGLAHDRDNADGQGAFSYGYGYTTPSGAGTIMSYARNRLPYFSNPAVSYNGEALGRSNFENSALAINKVAEYAANWRPSVDAAKPKDSITVKSPNGGNTLEPGNSYNITWNDNISENVKLELYKGGSFNRTITSSTSSDGSYSWTVPTSITDGSNYKVKITSISDSSVSDFSNSNFTIEADDPDDFITVKSPNGGNTLEPGKSYNITWNDNLSENVRIYLYKNDEFDRMITNSTASDGSYTWTIPESIAAGSDYQVAIQSVVDNNIFDYSNSNFTIKANDSITVKSPNGGNTLEPGKSYNITWNDNISENVRIYLYKNDEFDRTIASSTASDGSYTWTVPESIAAGSDYQVAIQSVVDNNIFDYSNSNFTIKANDSITVKSPNGGNTLEPGKSYNITWNDNISENVRIYLYKNDEFDSTIASSTASDGIYTWTVPESIAAGSDYKVAIQSIGDNDIYDFSNSNFTIKANEPDKFITVTSPNGGDFLITGNSYNLTWNDNISENVGIYLYKNNQFNRTISSSTASDGIYLWTVPTNLAIGVDYEIAIQSVVDGKIYDYSDHLFWIF